MFQVFVFLLAATLPGPSRAEPSLQPHAEPQQFACTIGQGGVERVNFGGGGAPEGFTRVTVDWSGRAPTTYFVRDDARSWFHGGEQALVLALQDPRGRTLRLGVRRQGEGVLYGLFQGGDGSPFPVACAKY